MQRLDPRTVKLSATDSVMVPLLQESLCTHSPGVGRNVSPGQRGAGGGLATAACRSAFTNRILLNFSTTDLSFLAFLLNCSTTICIYKSFFGGTSPLQLSMTIPNIS